MSLKDKMPFTSIIFFWYNVFKRALLKPIDCMVYKGIFNVFLNEKYLDFQTERVSKLKV